MVVYAEHGNRAVEGEGSDHDPVEELVAMHIIWIVIAKIWRVRALCAW